MIIAPLPFALINGQVADGSEVQANLDQIRDDVNNNAAGGGGAGNVVGPASAISGNLAIFDGTTGKILKDGGPAGYKGAVASSSSAISLPNNTDVFIPFNTEIIDTSSIHDNVTNPSRLTVPTGVNYVKIKAQVDVIGSISGVSGWMQARLQKNGSPLTPEGATLVPFNNPSSGEITIQVSSHVQAVTPGDYFEIALRQYSGLTCSAGANRLWFEMQILG